MRAGPAGRRMRHAVPAKPVTATGPAVESKRIGAMKKGNTDAQATDPAVAALRQAPAFAMRAMERELTKHIEKHSGIMASRDVGALLSVEAYTMLLFLADFAEADLSEKAYKALLKKFETDTPGNLKTYPKLSQSALFEIFSNLGISRESIRRLLILMAEHGLIERVSKGPPFPDELGISKAGGKLMTRVAKRLAKDAQKTKPFAYL